MATMTTRIRVLDWVVQYGVARGIMDRMVTSQVSSSSRSEVDRNYFERMFHAKIVVTVNPADWEGDFRLWEAMSTGALVFVDPLHVPHPYPLIGGEHVVYFDNANKTDLWTKLDYYRTHAVEARRIAVNGYLYAMKFHRTVNFADYVLRSAHLKLVQEQAVAALASPSVHGLGSTLAAELDMVAGYTYTAQSLLELATIEMVAIRKRAGFDAQVAAAAPTVASLVHAVRAALQLEPRVVRRKRSTPASGTAEIISVEDLQKMQIIYNHAHHSPRKGSDISSA